MKSQLPNAGPHSVSPRNSTWQTTSPAQYFDDPIPPRRVPPAPRRRPQLEALTQASHDWLSGLPPRYQPLTTARRHPHIVNTLSSLWADRQQIPAYLQGLMLSDRPGRVGFSFDVLTELSDLQSLLDLMKSGKPV